MSDGILVYLQGNRHAEYVLSPVAALARSLGEAVHLLYVVDCPACTPPVRLRSTQYRSPGLVDACNYVQHLRDWLMEQGICSEYTLGVGPAAECLSSLGIDRFRLLAMSLPSSWRPGRHGCATSPEEILRRAPLPALLYYPLPGTGTPPPWLTGLIAPLDGSAVAERALPWVESLAHDLRLPVRVARVVPDDALPWEFGPGQPAGHWTEDESDAALYLGATVVELRERGVGASPVLLRGDPGTEVATLARDHPTELVVMATSGHAGLGPWFVASVAQTVAYTSGAPVLVIPG